MPDTDFAIPPEWTFNSSDVAVHFDTHVREQLPWYDMVSDMVGLIARHYVETDGLVYDIGCSTGNLSRTLSALVDNRRVTLVGIDNSPAMRDVYPGGVFRLADAVEFDYEPFVLAVCFLVLQFIPNARRRLLLDKLAAKVKPDGAVIIVDKYSGTDDSSYLQTIKRRITLQGKVLSGTPADAVIAKELSLSGVQRPVDPVELFSGRKAVEFFRFGEFAGWIIEGR